MMRSFIIFYFLLAWSAPSHAKTLQECAANNPLICGSDKNGVDRIAVCLAKTKNGVTTKRTICIKPTKKLGKNLSVNKCGCCNKESGGKEAPEFCPNELTPTPSPNAPPVDTPLSIKDCESSDPLICGATGSGKDKFAVCLAKTKNGVTQYKTECVHSNRNIGENTSVNKCGCCVQESGGRFSPKYCPNLSTPTSSPTTSPVSPIPTKAPSDNTQKPTREPTLEPTASPVDTPLSLEGCASSNPLICGTSSSGENKVAVCLAKTKDGVTEYRTDCVKTSKDLASNFAVHKCGCCDEESGGKNTPGYCPAVPTASPSAIPTKAPSDNTQEPTREPTLEPTKEPTSAPSQGPTLEATQQPTPEPTPASSQGNTLEPTPALSQAPTVAASQQPTQKPSQEPTSDATDEPSQQPSTSAPLSPLSCPLPGEAPLLIDLAQSNTIKLQNSDDGSLCTLVELTTDDEIKPVGRSYNGFDWEQYAGVFATSSFSCDADDVCTVTLPSPPAGHGYVLTSFEHSLSTEDEAARFLEKSTFGPTRSEIAGFSSPLAWVQNQMSLPATSHRQFFRERATSWHTETAFQGLLSTHPCSQDARYRKYAFLRTDAERWVTIETSGSDRILSINGQIRTVVDSVKTGDSSNAMDEVSDGEYEICDQVQDEIGGRIRFRVSGSCIRYMWFGIEGVSVRGNPPILLDTNSLQSINTVSLDGKTQAVMTEFFAGEEQILQVVQDIDDGNCASFPSLPGMTEQSVFGTTTGADGTEYWLHTTSFKLLSNELEAPLVDGGKSLVDATSEASEERNVVQCSNAPMTFLNEDNCKLSSEACYNDGEVFDVEIPLSIESFQTIHSATGGETGSDTRYVYAVNGLEQSMAKNDIPPCTPEAQSRWVKVDDCTGGPSVAAQTSSIFENLLSTSSDAENAYLRDIFFPASGSACDSNDSETFDFKVTVDGQCWMNTHVDNWNVYDFTYWTESHPGNSESRNPIKEFAELTGTYTLIFPWHHDMSRWQNNKQNFPELGRFGDMTTLKDLPQELFREDVALAFGGSIASSGRGVGVVCGSPYEVETQFSTQSGTIRRGGFDIQTPYNVTSTDPHLEQQRATIWMDTALKSQDQLRQRVAWALYQILAVSPGAIDNNRQTESFLTYYDIFVRQAFGNYFDILKEVTYSPLMSEMLTYLNGQSTGYAYIQKNRLQFADENFAREIMQLFSIGLNKLNDDGTLQLDSNGEPMLSYTNEDITEYAKVYTGFQRQSLRGNVEDKSKEGSTNNQIDPMQIRADYRDHFPKLGLNSQYIGDGYPLCSDLPDKHFLKEGATYRLLGEDPKPHLLGDPEANAWHGAAPRRVSLDLESPLAIKICNKSNPSDDNEECNFLSKVVIDEDLTCEGIECDLNDVRSIEVSPGIWYEYVRPACVHRAFYENAMSVRRMNGSQKYMCADPLVESASTTCCNVGSTKNTNTRAGVELYGGERVTFDVAEQRCEDAGKRLCSDPSVNGALDCPDVSIGGCDRQGLHYWSSDTCNLHAKLNLDGTVAIIHETTIPGKSSSTRKMVASSTKMFFRVEWLSPESDVQDFLSDYSSKCAEIGCQIDATDGICQCGVSDVVETAAYTDGSLASASVDDILSTATIGAFPPTVAGEEVMAGVWKYPTGSVTHSTVFRVVDSNGIEHYRKNIKSVVTVGSLSFRNPVHFMSLNDPNIRDAQYETDAALEHYFYHPNTAPFLALRLAQRFGVSNPSPRYIQTIAAAFRTGVYDAAGTSIGNGDYGDMKATIAAVLLDRESQDSILDADPVHGALLEPFMKIVRVMRSLEFEAADHSPLVKIERDMQTFIGQEPHKLPSVFSFFKPEFQPGGSIANAGLVSPESQVLNGPTSVNLVNTMLSYIKYGMNSCYYGFGDGSGSDCSIGNSPSNDGSNTYAPDSNHSPSQIVDELATVLTSGRLSESSRGIVEQAYVDTLAEGKSSSEALINAQQLIVTTPEFHTSGISKKTGNPRLEATKADPTGKPYKAVVYLMLSGGFDSYNMLVPETCSGKNAAGQTVREQYDQERGVLAFDGDAGERDLTITAKKQPCAKFAIHDELQIVKDLYDDGDLTFFANTGVINQNGMDKTNFKKLTKTQLFAHNTMQEEAKKVDPYSNAPGTGILGRAKDVLTNNGHVVNSLSIDDLSVALEGVPGVAKSTTIVGRTGVNTFAGKKSSEEDYFDIESYAKNLNAEIDGESSNMHGETWSQQFFTGITEGKGLEHDLASANLTESIWYDDNGKQLEGDKGNWQKWSTIFKLMQTRENRNVDRDIFYTEFGAHDHHAFMKTNLRNKFKNLNFGLTMFVNQLKDADLWDKTTIVLVSDFGRTLTPNSNDGSDHAWGGNYFMMGGQVKGGKVLGEYPYDLTPDGPLNVGRGRIMPTTSWDAIWNGVIEWLGVDPDDMDQCLPNAANTVDDGFQIFSKADLFQADQEAQSSGLRGGNTINV